MKYALKVTAILFAGLAGVLIILILIIHHFFFSMAHLPTGEFLTEATSPNGDYTVNVYVSKNGATVADAVRGEVINHQKKNKVKNIYWAYRESDAEIIWLDEETVAINGVQLDVRKEVYDWRKDN